MKKIFRYYFVVCCLLYPLIFTVKYFNVEWAEKIFVPAFVLLVFAFNVYLNPLAKGKNIFLFFAFFFVCLGDIIINLFEFDTVAVVSFLLTHANLILYYSSRQPWGKADVKYLMPVALLSAAIFLLTRPRMTAAWQLAGFGVYLTVLSVMLWRAVCLRETNDAARQKWLIIGGSLLFYCTDVAVSANVVFNTKILLALTWICYTPALFMLSVMNYPFRWRIE
jgi:hypothetical protein